jgi:hypothetical protein
MKSLVGRNPAVSSTTVEATTNFAHHRPPITEISWARGVTRSLEKVHETPGEQIAQRVSMVGCGPDPTTTQREHPSRSRTAVIGYVAIKGLRR